jgi:hypothetical protein
LNEFIYHNAIYRINNLQGDFNMLGLIKKLFGVKDTAPTPTPAEAPYKIDTSSINPMSPVAVPVEVAAPVEVTAEAVTQSVAEVSSRNKAAAAVKAKTTSVKKTAAPVKQAAPKAPRKPKTP